MGRSTLRGDPELPCGGKAMTDVLKDKKNKDVKEQLSELEKLSTEELKKLLSIPSKW